MSAQTSIATPPTVRVPVKMTLAVAMRERALALACLQRISMMDGPAGVAAREHLARVKGERA